MNILWFTWKDRTHPQAGGAELLNEELAKRLVKDGHNVIFLVGGYTHSKKKEIIDGYTVIRVGGRYTVYLAVFLYYLRHLRGWANFIIEEVNTMPFMTQWYTKEKKVLLIYQLCREIWFHQIFFPLNVIGFFIEPLYLWLLRKNIVLTESESAKIDMLHYGFDKKKVHIFPAGIELPAVKDITSHKKYTAFTILSLGAIREMKRTCHQLQAFELAKKDIPELQLKIGGDGSGAYGRKVLNLIHNSVYKKDIEYLGKVSKDKKKKLMQDCHIILGTSVKEGWGLTITEAASQGTPAVVYNVDGLRDSVRKNQTGLICNNTPEQLANAIKKLYKDKKLYKKLRKNAWIWSKTLTFDNCYKVFKNNLKL